MVADLRRNQSACHYLTSLRLKVAEMLKSLSKSLVFFSYCLYIVRVLLECDIIDMSPPKNKG
jgi:hypothetical protein